MRNVFNFRPIEAWPGKLRTSRRSATFRSGYSQTLDQLDRELCHLRARSVVIQLAINDSEIRNDGLPSARANPRHPGVILSFESPKGSMSFPCDTYADWTDNLRAIAKSLEALRAVDRYGVTQRAEQYKGWAKLPPGQPIAASMTVEEAANIVAGCAGDLSFIKACEEALRASA